MDNPCEALLQYEKALETSLRFLRNEPQDSSSQRCLYKSIDLIENILKKIDEVSVAEESYERTNKYFDELMDTYEKLIVEHPEKPSYLWNYIKTVNNLRGYLLNVGKSEKQIQLINSTLETFEKILNIRPENPEIFEKLDEFVKELGEEFLDNELFEDAKKIYEQLQGIYRSLLENYPDNELALRYLIFSYGYFWDLYSRQGHLNKIEETYQPALSIIEDNLRKNPENTALLENRGKIYEEIGVNYSEAEDPEKANSYYEKALANFVSLKGKFPDDLDYQVELGNIFANLGKLFKTINHIENAEKSYLHKIEIYESLFEEDPEDEDLKLDNIDTLMHIGNLYVEAGDAEQAKEYYEKAIGGYEMLLSENPEATDFEISISDILISIGDMYAKVGDDEMEPEDAELETAREYYEKALKRNEKEFERYPDDLTCQDELIRTLGKLGDSFTAQDRYEDAIPFYQRIVEIKEQLIREDPRRWLDINVLTNFRYQLGSYYGKIEEAEMERKQYSKAAELYSRVLHDKNLQLPIKQVLAVEVQSHGIDLLKSRKYDAAEEALDLALEFFESLYEEDPEDAENYPYICEALYQSGNLQKALGNFEEAAKSFDSLLPIVEKLLESDPESPETRENAGATYTNAGEVYSLTGEHEKSKQAFGKSLTINAALLEEEPDNPIYRIDQAETFEKYAKLLSKLGRNEEAEDYITKSEEIYRKLAEEDSNEGDVNE